MKVKLGRCIQEIRKKSNNEDSESFTKDLFWSVLEYLKELKKITKKEVKK